MSVFLSVCASVAQPLSDSLRPHCPWDFSGKTIRVNCCFPPSGDLPNPGTEPESPMSSVLQVDSLPVCSSSLS